MSFTSIEPYVLTIPKFRKKVYETGLKNSRKITDLIGMINASLMTISTLDFYFPFIVFFYGLVMIFVLEIPALMELARVRMPSQYVTFQKHRKIAVLSLFVGGLWSLQNIWFF